MLAAVFHFLAILVTSVHKPLEHQPTLDSQLPGSLEALLAGQQHVVNHAVYDSSFSNSQCAKKMCEELDASFFPEPSGYNNKEFKLLKQQLLWECKLSLCNPLCLHTAWGTEFKVGSCSDSGERPDGKPSKFCKRFKPQVERRSTQIALGAQIQAHACDTMLGCCKNPMNKPDDPLHWLPRWVEERMYGNQFPNAALPISACERFVDPFANSTVKAAQKKYAKMKCNKCKSAIQVEVTVNECGWPQGMAYREGEEMKDSSPPEDPKKLFDRLKFPRKMQTPKWTSYASRCVAMKKTLDGKKGAIKSKMSPEQVCKCLGCCEGDPVCFYPETFDQDFSKDG